MQKIFLIVFTLFLGACTYDYVTPKVDPLPSDVKLSFAKDVQPIFTNSCIACHNGSTNPDLREGKSHAALLDGKYVNTDIPEQSKVYLEVNSGGMPLGGNKLAQGEIDTILVWIKQGASDN